MRPRVVVGVDGTHCSRAALQFAIREVIRRGCGLEVVTCWALDGPLGPRSLHDARVSAERMQDQAVSAALAEVPPPAMMSRRIVEGSPGPALVGAARDAGLLVVGTAHKGLARRALLGSVSQYCLLHSPVPVTVVPELSSPAAESHRWVTPAVVDASR